MEDWEVEARELARGNRELARLKIVRGYPKYDPVKYALSQSSRRVRVRESKITAARTGIGYDSVVKREWMGIDGEGWGTDSLRRQCYRVMCAATDTGFYDVLHTHERERITTTEALRWLVSLDGRYKNWCARSGIRYHKVRLCGFALGYDYAQILIEMADEDITLIKSIHTTSDFTAPHVLWRGEFGLKLTAGRLEIQSIENGAVKNVTQVWDCFKFFQSTFLKAIKQVVSPEELPVIEAGKVRRTDNDHDMDQEVLYCRTECKVLARLMAKVEQQALAIGIFPNSWYGPGSFAGLALKKYGVGSHYVPDDVLEPQLKSAATKAFVAGRFENTGHGYLPRLYEYDIKSAYPTAIKTLPCLKHIEWEYVTGPRNTDCDPHWSLYNVSWSNHSSDLCGGWGPWHVRDRRIPIYDDEVLSVRDVAIGMQDFKTAPSWPWVGKGWIWGPEYRSGLKLLEWSPKATSKLLGTWIPYSQCSCIPFAWIGDVYEQRKVHAANNDPRAGWLKLILNSLYGKMAQQVGNGGKWHSWLWSGMITADTRSRILDAVSINPEAVMMIATDAVYSRSEFAGLEIGEELGNWESAEWRNVLLIQVGMMKGEKLVDGQWKSVLKTRGFPPRYAQWHLVEDAWRGVLNGTLDRASTTVTIDRDMESGEVLQRFVGIALSANEPCADRMAVWEPSPKEIHFISGKRPISWERPLKLQLPGWVYTKPATNSPELPFVVAPRNIQLDFIRDQPDAIEWGSQ